MKRSKKLCNKKTKKRNYIEMAQTSNFYLESIIEKNNITMNPSLKIDYNINFQLELEKNNLSYTKTILKPNPNTINKLFQTLDRNYIILYDNMLNKIIDENIIFKRTIYGDGNCYFRSLSFFFTNSQNYHDFFRNYTCKRHHNPLLDSVD